MNRSASNHASAWSIWPAFLNVSAVKRLAWVTVFRFDMLTQKTSPLDAGLLGPAAVLEAQNDLIHK